MSKFDLRTHESRRAFMKKTAYVAPVILTLNAIPAFASHGSADVNDHVDDGSWPPHDPGPQGPDDPGPPASGGSVTSDGPRGGRSGQTGWGG
jgi:hypothetical protein